MKQKGPADTRHIVEAAQAGDAAAFTELVRRFQNMAYAYAVSLLADLHLAEDAAQEAFVDAHRALPQLRSSAAFVSWFRRIVFKQCDRIRRRVRSEVEPFEEDRHGAGGSQRPTGATDPAELFASSAVRQEVLAAIGTLPEHERTVVSLYYTDEYALREIASFLDITESSVKSRLHRARARLRTTLTRLMEETMGSLSLPDSFATTVARIVADEDDLQGARTYLSGSFHDRNYPSQLSDLATARDTGIYVVRDEDGAQSAGYYNEVDFSIEGVRVRAVRPNEIAREGEGVPDPVFVRGFSGCAAIARRRGVNLAVVHGSMFDHAFVGFVPAFYHPVATASVAEIAALPPASARVRPIETPDERDAAQAAFLADPYASKIGGFAPREMNYLIEDAGGAIGYLAWHIGWDGKPFLASASVHGRSAAVAALRFLAEHTEGEEVLVQESHMTDLTRAVLDANGRYLLRPSCPLPGLDNEMVAIISFPGLTEELLPAFQRRCAFPDSAAPALRPSSRPAGMQTDCPDAPTSFSLEMDGEVVGFSLDHGKLSLSGDVAPVHRKLPRWVATRLLLGYYSGEEVRGMGSFPDSDGGSCPDSALFDALFPKLWPSSLPDPDVLPWLHR